MLEQALQRGANKVIEVLFENSLAVRWVGPDEGKFEDADLANVNTPEDLRNLRDVTGPGSGPSLNM